MSGGGDAGVVVCCVRLQQCLWWCGAVLCCCVLLLLLLLLLNSNRSLSCELLGGLVRPCPLKTAMVVCVDIPTPSPAIAGRGCCMECLARRPTAA